MFSDWSSCALIGYYVHWLVTMPSDWSLCPLIGHHVLWLVIISYYVTSRNSIIKSKRPPYRQTDMFNILQILLHLKTYIIKFAYMGKFRWPYRSVPIPITTTYYLLTYFRPNQFYRMDSTSSSTSTSTRPSQAALVEAKVEVEAQPTRLGRLRLRLRQRPSLY